MEQDLFERFEMRRLHTQGGERLIHRLGDLQQRPRGRSRNLEDACQALPRQSWGHDNAGPPGGVWHRRFLLRQVAGVFGGYREFRHQRQVEDPRAGIGRSRVSSNRRVILCERVIGEPSRETAEQNLIRRIELKPEPHLPAPSLSATDCTTKWRASSSYLGYMIERFRGLVSDLVSSLRA